MIKENPCFSMKNRQKQVTVPIQNFVAKRLFSVRMTVQLSDIGL